MSNLKIIGISLFYLFSCSKQPQMENCIDGSPIKGSNVGVTTINTNFIEWNNEPCYFSESLNGKYVLTTSSFYNNCDAFKLNINNLTLSKSKNFFDFNFESPIANLFIIHGGDALAEQFEVSYSSNNSIQINEISKDSSEITGVLNLFFVLSNSSIGKGLYKPDLPDTLIFRNGVFTAKLIK